MFLKSLPAEYENEIQYVAEILKQHLKDIQADNGGVTLASYL